MLGKIIKKLFTAPSAPELEPDIEPGGDSVLKSLDKNAEALDALFLDVDIMLSRRFANAENDSVRFILYHSDGVSDMRMINEHIVEPLMGAHLFADDSLLEQIKNEALSAVDFEEADKFSAIIKDVCYGDTALFIDGCNKALVISSKAFSLRAVSEPEGEKVLSGPREGFTESLMTNLSLVRRRIRTNELKMKMKNLGSETKTGVCVAYLDNIVNKNLLAEVNRRLEKVDIDSVLDGNYLVEFIAEHSRFGVSTVGTTERPDSVASKLLEGRIAIFTDGSPVVLTVPLLFWENFQSSEDYYTPFLYASYSRFLRLLSFIMTITVPSIYIAVVAFHHDILPSPLMLSIARSQKDVPLPAAVECFVMLLLFDILREAGVRMPSHVGQALSIVGALVIGQAAVEARLVSAPMIIVVAITGITILMVPNLSTTSLLARYFCLSLASAFGLVGMMVGITILFVHILQLESFGVPVFMPIDSLREQDVKDTFIRAPWPKMLERMRPYSYNIRRQGGQKS
ncbi:MAG: spore germination protein [Oscillospiraceae bacterium]|jgi:spore germination protein KA|nr:spore germination protein [Oscillospiraceae bacterium]